MLVALIVAEVRPGGPGARGKVSQAQTLPPTPMGPARWGFGDPDTAQGATAKTQPCREAARDHTLYASALIGFQSATGQRAKNKNPWGNSTLQSRMQNAM